MRTAFGALIYFGLVFGAGFLFGPVRIVVLEPRVGPFWAVVCEAPILLGAMFLGARVAPRWAAVPQRVSALAVLGALALALQQVADYSIGLLLRGISIVEQLQYLRSPAGLVYVLLLGAFGLMPVAVHAVDAHVRRSRRAAGFASAKPTDD